MGHRSLPFSQNTPIQSTPVLLPGKRPSIHKQMKWALDQPLMPVIVIVSANDTPSQQKSKLIPAPGVEDDDSRPK
jgi:hypothetical protein